MKKLVVFIALILLPSFVRAYDVVIDGIYYNLLQDTKKAEVTHGDNKYAGSVVIPSSVTYKGMEYSVTSLGNFAFSQCTGLNTIVIPNSVIEIKTGAFSFCTGLTSVDIPISVTTIGGSSFSNCRRCFCWLHWFDFH